MRFTQSISLSNIQSLHLEGPALRRLKPAGPAIEIADQPASRSASSFNGGDQETAIDSLVELTGIEPVTPCLQSRCSPS